MVSSYRILAAIPLILAAAACSYVDDGFREQAFPVEKQLVFSASFQTDGDATSRTVLQSDGKVFWSPKEAINVFNGTVKSKFTSTNTTPSRIANFTGSITLTCDTPLPYVAVYPYSESNSADGSIVTMTLPSAQKTRMGSFSDGMSPALARTAPTFEEQPDLIPLNFKNLCSGLKFSLAHSGITSVVFKGNNGENLAGKVKVTLGDDGVPVVSQFLSGEKEITLTIEKNDPGYEFPTDTWFYLTFPPLTLSKGFTVTFNTSSETGAYVYDGSVTFKRSVWKKAAGIDKGVLFMDKGATVINTVTAKSASDNPAWPTLTFKNGEEDLESVFSGNGLTWSGNDDGSIMLHNVLPLFLQYCNSKGFTYKVFDKTVTMDGKQYHKAQFQTRLPHIVFFLITKTGDNEGRMDELFTYNGNLVNGSLNNSRSIVPLVSPDGELVLLISADMPYDTSDDVIVIPFTTQYLVTRDFIGPSAIGNHIRGLVPENIRDYNILDPNDYVGLIEDQQDLDYSPIW